MIPLAQRGGELYSLFEGSGAIGNLDEAFCRALGTALDAREVWLFESADGTGSFSCRRAWGSSMNQDQSGRRGFSIGQGLCGTAALTGQIASHFESFEPSSQSDEDGRGNLRFAVPILIGSKCVLVIEILKRQSSPQPHETDIFLLRTFGALYALHMDSPHASNERNGHPRASVRPENETVEAIGKSSAFKRSHLLMIKAARTDCPVLILGETGTGKDLVARQLHEASRRRGKPFVAINCGALSDTVLESEFFGHVHGAFTGAYRSRKGKLEEANGGTVFLDEVAEMSPACQVKLLRTLDTGEITPLGGNKTIKINARFIAATHRNLETLIQQGKFREDLYYRLQGMQIELPPLRRRRGDAELLAHFFLEHEVRLQESSVRGFSPEAKELLKAYEWPGNVRELKSAIASAITLADGEWIQPGDLSASIRTATPSSNGSNDITPPTNDEQTRIVKALQTTAYPGTGRWNIRGAARQLKMNHQTLAYKMRKVYRLKE